jgi:L-Ala-D/L-Glu epimerase
VQITNVQTAVVTLPLRETFRTAVRETDSVEAVQVIIWSGAEMMGVGYGTATPAITGDTIESITRFVTERATPLLVGRELDDRLRADLQRMVRDSSSGVAAVDLALDDLRYRRIQPDLHSVCTSITISAGTTDEMVSAAIRRIDLGFRIFKLKLGADPSGDAERLRVVTETLRSHGCETIWVDANQGWTERETMSIMDAAERDGVLPGMLEQPVAAGSLRQLSRIGERLSLPVFADESARHLGDIDRIADLGGVTGINVKFMKFGGPTGSRAAVTRAYQHGMRVLVGSMLEHPASVAAAVRFAATQTDGSRDLVHDLDAGWWFVDAPQTTYRNSYVHV